MASANLNAGTRERVSAGANGAHIEEAQLLTAKSFQRWRTQHASALGKAVEKRQMRAKEVEAERFAKARNAVIGGVMRWMREGYTAAEAGKQLVQCFSDRGGYTYTDLLVVLQEIGANPFGKFRKGGEA